MFCGFNFKFLLLFVFLITFNILSAQWVQFNQTNTGETLNNATCIWAVNSGIVWIGTIDHGLYQYDGSNDIWTEISAPSTSNFPYNNINSIYISGSNLYVTTPFLGVGVFNGSSWSTISVSSTSNGLPDDETYGTAVDSKGNLWIATYSGLAKDSTNNSWYKYQNALYPSLPADDLYNIYIDNKDSKWLGTHGFGLVKFKDGVFTVYDMNNSGIPDNTVNKVKRGPDGSYWIGTNSGLAKFDGSNIWTVYNTGNTSNGLPGNIINDITFDAQGNIYAATNGGLGVLMKAGNFWNTFTTPDLPENNVTGVSIDPQTEKIWISTNSSGIASYDHNLLGITNHNSTISSDSFSIYPNPAFDESYIKYEVLKSAEVQISITDLSGKLILSVLNEVQSAGNHTEKINLKEISAGMYLIGLQVGGQSGIKRLMVIK